MHSKILLFATLSNDPFAAQLAHTYFMTYVFERDDDLAEKVLHIFLGRVHMKKENNLKESVELSIGGRTHAPLRSCGVHTVYVLGTCSP
jgi:hypothetical protein